MEHRRIPVAAQLGQPGDVFDDGGAAWAVVDQQGIVTGWSEGARQLLGHPPDEVVGKPAARLLDEDLPPEMLREIKALKRWSGRVRLRHRNGHRVECGLIAHHRAKSDTGSDWFLVCPIAGAITPEDHPLIEQSFQQSPCCALNLFDTDARLRRGNAYSESALGLTEAETRGLRISEFDLDPEIARIERAVGQALETGEAQFLETYGQTPGESREHAWSVHAYPVRDESGAVRGVGVACHDMTEQYWARKRLQLLSDASVRIGSTLDVARTAQELAEVAVPEFADFATVDLLVGSGPRPGTARPGAVRLRRVAHQSILPGIPEAVVPLGEVDAYAVDSPTAECLATGNAVLCADDIALLIARTRTLDARHVASWDLPADPAIVAQARKLVAAQLMAWDLMEASFVTELIISELVTNAIRYAAPPIQLRLIHDRHLICEVSDASSTAPHLRRAHTYDEGGRGLLLVAQLTRGWGTRYGETGKTIWAEQVLDATQPGV
jgi:PAS domain S-box-containing protein